MVPDDIANEIIRFIDEQINNKNGHILEGHQIRHSYPELVNYFKITYGDSVCVVTFEGDDYILGYYYWSDHDYACDSFNIKKIEFKQRISLGDISRVCK